jgi:hypothetical protein
MKDIAILTTCQKQFTSLGVDLISSRDARIFIEIVFSLKQGLELSQLQLVFEMLKPRDSLGVADPFNGDELTMIRADTVGFSIKKGRHGAAGTWREANFEMAFEFAMAEIVAISHGNRKAELIFHKYPQ